MQYKTHILHHQVCDHQFDLECLVSLDETVDEMFHELERLGSQDLLEELCPYFGVIWPAAQALSEWMCKRPRSEFAGKSVLELGCGLALPSFVAGKLGAKVTATDLHPDVPDFLDRNLALNPDIQIQFTPLDWRAKVQNPKQWDWILASDVLYEKEYAASLVGFLRTHLKEGGRAVVTDPQRPYCDRFEQCLQENGFSFEKLNSKVPTTAQICNVYVVSRL